MVETPRGGATIGGGGVKQPPYFSKFSVLTVFTHHLPMHCPPPTFKFVAPPLETTDLPPLPIAINISSL